MNLSQTVRLLGNTLGQVLVEQESDEIFELEEDIRNLSKERRTENPKAQEQLRSKVESLTSEQARAVASAFALYFDLINLAEENDRISNGRLYCSNSGKTEALSNKKEFSGSRKKQK